MSIWIEYRAPLIDGMVTSEYADREQAARAMRYAGIEEWEVVDDPQTD